MVESAEQTLEIFLSRLSELGGEIEVEKKPT